MRTVGWPGSSSSALPAWIPFAASGTRSAQLWLSWTVWSLFNTTLRLYLSVSSPERSTLQCKALSELIPLGLFVYMQAETEDEILELMGKENPCVSSPLVASPWMWGDACSFGARLWSETRDEFPQTHWVICVICYQPWILLLQREAVCRVSRPNRLMIQAE